MTTTKPAICAAFVLNGERHTIELAIEPAQMIGHGRTIDLEPIPADALEVSICGESGQNIDDFRDSGVVALDRLCDLWDRWHLNGMRAGNRKQLEHLVHLADDKATHDENTARLADAGLLESDGYKYGSAWLYEPISVEVIEELKQLVIGLRGKRFGDAPDLSDAPDMDGQVLDSRDVIKRLEAYRDAAAALDDEDESDDAQEIREELAALEAFEEDASGSADWSHGETLIREDYFTEYAQQLADDIGAISRDAKWPNTHIDWDAAAEELKADYITADYKGTTYLIRG